MDARRALPFLLLVICVISAASAIRNGRDVSSSIRRIRRISLNEYLVPPPIPRLYSRIRIGRLAPHPTEAPGYFTRLMSWLNPFGSSSEPPPPPPPPPPLSPAEAASSYSTSSNFIQPPPPPGLPANYGPSAYDKPPLPAHTFNDNSGYPSAARAKSCNSCNKVPWMPVNGEHPQHAGDAAVALPPPPLPELPSLNGDYPPPANGDYLPPANGELSHDAHHAASQQIKAPDFSFVGPLPNPHLYAGAVPPLFKAGDFNYPPAAPDGNAEYLAPPPPGDNALPVNDTYPNLAQPSFNSGHNEQPVYSDPTSHADLGPVHQELGYNNAGAGNGQFNHYGGDLSSSGTQVSHASPVPDKDFAYQPDSLNFITHQSSFGSNVPSHQPSAVSNNGGLYDVTGSNGPLGDLLGNASQIGQHPPSYGISSLERAPNNHDHRYNDLSTGVNVDSHAPSRNPDGSSAKIEHPIRFEQSPLLDFTRKGESRTDSSSIPPTSNALAGFENAKIAGPTLTPGNLGAHRDGADGNAKLESGGDDLKTLRGQDVFYIPPSGQAGYLWSNILSTTSRVTEPYWSTKSYDDVAEEASNQSVNSRDKTSSTGAKRNKQVQVIIPYTSQYTPLPFHPRKVPHADESNHDNYVGEESRNRIKVTSLPDSSHASPTWPTTLEDVTKKPDNIKANNVIELHKLQKNIDNWTIQEYSKGTTASTASPSSVNPYLFPSKQIPDEYLTTTEPVNVASLHNDNNNFFTLAGFGFNDLDYKSSASNHVEGSRIQVTQTENSKPTESSVNVVTASKDGNVWQDFPLDISPVDKERVYVVTPQPVVTTSNSSPGAQKKEKAAKEAERNSKELKKASEEDRKKTNTFDSIEKAYQVLPQAVNNLAVASTGPESVPLWGIMEHEEFATLGDSEDENEDTETPQIPVLYAGHSKVSRARR